MELKKYIAINPIEVDAIFYDGSEEMGKWLSDNYNDIYYDEDELYPMYCGDCEHLIGCPIYEGEWVLFKDGKVVNVIYATEFASLYTKI